MKVAEYDRYGGPDVIVVRDRPIPRPGPKQVLVRVHAAALNPKDMLTRAGKYALISGQRFPKRMGYDWAGEVEAVGLRVTNVRKGDHVFGMIQAWSGGSCAEYLLAEQDELFEKPASLSWEEAAALPLAGLTALQALRDQGRLRAGQRVLINGASGGVGVNAVQLAKALGAHVTTLTSEANREFVCSLGAHEAFDYRAHDLAGAGLRYDVIFDVWGNRSFASVRTALEPNGTYVTTVPTAKTMLRQVLTMRAAQRARLVFVRSHSSDLAVIAELVERGALRAIVSQMYTLETLPDAHRALATKRTRGKLVVRIAG